MAFEFAPDKSAYRRGWNAQEASNMNSAARTFLTQSGASFLDFGGGNADDDQAAWTIQVPEDYVSGGVFYVRATSPGTANDFQLEMDVIAAGVGDNVNNAQDVDLGPVIAGGNGAAWDLIEFGPFTPSTAVLAAGKALVVRIHRDASDAGDTATNIALSVCELILEYKGA